MENKSNMIHHQSNLPVLDYHSYNLEAYITPIWENNVVYNESLMFVPNPVTKEIDPAPLLYTPDEILAVQSSDYSLQYKEGFDYRIENNHIRLTKNSRIPVWSYDDYYLLEPAAYSIQSAGAKGRYVRYANGCEFSKMQIAVTYRHEDKWTGIKPGFEGDKLTRTILRLKAKQPVTIVYYGDSIMEGCEASGRNRIKPYMPIFTAMVTEQLKKSYGYEDIYGHNTALGGTNSNWGKINAKERISQYKPDLAVINFGMNDSTGNISIEDYEQNTRDIIETVRTDNQKAEFVLISSGVPNPDCSGWTHLQASYRKSLEAIAMNTPGVMVSPMTQIQEYLLTRKRYDDMNGNGVNHPNDFFARVYAQAISQALIETIR